MRHHGGRALCLESAGVGAHRRGDEPWAGRGDPLRGCGSRGRGAELPAGRLQGCFSNQALQPAPGGRDALWGPTDMLVPWKTIHRP